MFLMLRCGNVLEVARPGLNFLVNICESEFLNRHATF